MTRKKRFKPATLSDPDDAVELTDEFFETTELNKGNKIQTRGRPKTATTK